ncbi:MAG: phosphate acyltransferase PlsX [Gemmataceae bacterium]
MRIALDAMGGDHAPGPIVAGAVQAVQADPELTVVLVGDQAQVEPLLPADADRSRLEIFHCTQTVGMDEKPTVALRTKPDSSIRRCWELLAFQKVDGIVSAGNTGAMVAGGHISKRVLPEVHRPGIATVMPSEKGPVVLIDVGANTEAKPEHLLQYGIMGAVYAKHILNIPEPLIGLMNVGEEEGKGNPVTKEAHALLSALGPRFKGNVEGRDVQQGVVSVVVCDGFVGNILLKYSEGVSAYLIKAIQTELLPLLTTDKESVLGAWKQLMMRYDYATYGGAPLLGIDGACIICHGSSRERAIKNALGVAAQFARTHLNEVIVQELRATTPKA